MSLEIERKFVLRGEINESVLRIPGLPPVHLREGEDIIQGYLPVELLDELLVEFPTLPNKFDPAEIRLRKKGADYFLAMKGEGGLVREEYEIEVDASIEHRWIRYVRLRIDRGQYLWECPLRPEIGERHPAVHRSRLPANHQVGAVGDPISAQDVVEIIVRVIRGVEGNHPIERSQVALDGPKPIGTLIALQPNLKLIRNRMRRSGT